MTLLSASSSFYLSVSIWQRWIRGHKHRFNHFWKMIWYHVAKKPILSGFIGVHNTYLINEMDIPVFQDNIKSYCFQFHVNTNSDSQTSFLASENEVTNFKFSHSFPVAFLRITLTLESMCFFFSRILSITLYKFIRQVEFPSLTRETWRNYSETER